MHVSSRGKPPASGKAEEELLVAILPSDDPESDEAGQQRDDFRSRQMGAAHHLVEGELLGLSGGHRLQQTADTLGIGHHGAALRLLLTPDGQVDGRCHDVLVGDADIGALTAILADGADRLALGGRNGGNDDSPAIGMIKRSRGL